MLDGSFETRIASRRLECTPATTWTEPREERHANHVGTQGARVLVTQPHPDHHELLAPFRSLLDEVGQVRDPSIAVEARRVAAEMADPDSLAPLAMDAHVLLMMTRAARVMRPRGHHRRPPRWLVRARDLIHARFRERLDLLEIASSVDVTPWHLAREFRRHFHANMGEYARSLRVEWALRELAADGQPIADIAHGAGYADQSHLTKACKAATGLTPAAYRRRQTAGGDHGGAPAAARVRSTA
jgi:AraC family transcriptional regulator